MIDRKRLEELRRQKSPARELGEFLTESSLLVRYLARIVDEVERTCASPGDPLEVLLAWCAVDEEMGLQGMTLSDIRQAISETYRQAMRHDRIYWQRMRTRGGSVSRRRCALDSELHRAVLTFRRFAAMSPLFREQLADRSCWGPQIC